MLLKVIIIAGRKRRKIETEEGWRHRLWNEAKQQAKDAGEAWVAQLAQVTAPTRSQRNRQEKRANDALKEYEKQRFRPYKGAERFSGAEV